MTQNPGTAETNSADLSGDSDVLLFRDGDDLFIQGAPADVSVIIEQLLSPHDAQARRDGVVRRGAVDAAAVAASGGALAATSAELMRFTPESVAKVKEFGLSLDENNAIRSTVTRANGRIAGNLKMETVSFGPEQALALQSAAVTLALRTAIAKVEDAVAEVDTKVTELLSRERNRQIGEVAGLQAKLKRLSDETTQRGRLLTADWDSVATAGPSLEQALTALRAHAADKINTLHAAANLTDRVDALEHLSQQSDLPTLLQLILVAEDALHRWEHLRVQRVRDTEPAEIDSALASARATLSGQREADKALIESAHQALGAARVIAPLAWPRFHSITQTHRLASQLTDAVEAFATATRFDMPKADRLEDRPSFSDARQEAARKATQARKTAASFALEAGRGAKESSTSAANRARERVSVRARRRDKDT